MATVLSRINESILAGSKSLRGPQMGCPHLVRMGGSSLTIRAVLRIISTVGIMIVNMGSNSHGTECGWNEITVLCFVVS